MSGERANRERRREIPNCPTAPRIHRRDASPGVARRDLCGAAGAAPRPLPRLACAAVIASLVGSCAQSHLRSPDGGGLVDAAAGPPDAATGTDAALGLDAALGPDAPDAACGPGGIGSPCATDADCTVHAPFSPAICMPRARGAPRGYCTSVCMVDAECGPCGRCGANETGTAPALGWYGFCVRSCDEPASCDLGYVCAPIAAARLGCFPDCRSQPGLCGPGRCGATTGTCTFACAVDTDCSDGSRCVSSRCACGAGTPCAWGCVSDEACGPGHTCDATLGCCWWGGGLCG